MAKKMIIFDWNGTLIDDVWLNLNAINGVLEKRGIKPITTEYYRENFQFPVSVFYKELAGLAADTKPVAALATGSMFLEVDTGDVYAFDEASSEWHKIGALGGDD